MRETDNWKYLYPEARPKEPAYSYIENPVVKPTSTPQMPISSERGHTYGSPAGAGELVVRQRSFERVRPRGTPAYGNSSPDGDVIIIRRQDRERYRDVGENSYEMPAQRERYPSPSRSQEIVIRRDDHEVPEYKPNEVFIRRNERSPSEDMAISPEPYHYSPPQRPRQLIERPTEQQKELEKLRLKEEIMRLKEERAASRHDYTTANDLARNAIPEIQAQIRRLEAYHRRRYPNRQVSDYEIVEESRHPYIPRSPPIRRTSTFDDDTWPNAASKALVLRTGGSRQPDDYLREQILDRSIRIRGDTDDSILPVKDVIIERHRTSPDSRQSSYSERDRRHVSRRPTLESELVFEERSSRAHGGYSNGRPRHRDVERVKNRPWRSRPAFSSSEDDDYRPIRRRTASKQQPGPSNEELITQTLKRFTTFQGDRPPSATQTSPADTSSRQPIPAANGDISTGQEFQSTKLPLSTASRTLSVTALGQSQAEPSAPLGFGTMSEEPGTMAEGTSPQSPTQVSSYPSMDGSSPQPGALPSPPLYNCPICKPEPGQAKRHFTRPDHLAGHLESVHRDKDGNVPYVVNGSLRDPQGNTRAASRINGQAIPAPPLPRRQGADGPSLSDFSIDYVLAGVDSPTKPTPGAGRNEQPKATKEPRITEVSDESSEDGRRRLRKEDRKATVEDLEPDLEAGQIDSGTKIYE